MKPETRQFVKEYEQYRNPENLNSVTDADLANFIEILKSGK